VDRERWIDGWKEMERQKNEWMNEVKRGISFPLTSGELLIIDTISSHNFAIHE
jgi:hypothetical protein